MKTQKVCLGIKIICQLDKQVQVLSSCEHSSQALRDSICHVMSLSVTAYPFPWSRRVLLLEPISALSQDEGRVLPGQVASSSQGPHWWAMWDSVSHSKTLRHVAQPCPEQGFKPATFRSLVNLLYPLSYSRPDSVCVRCFTLYIVFYVCRLWD